ncbi:MAG: helix-turn-helix domain-containing protein [Myxococcales bacterium]|nr:helix-turn-helix domain-containing protein [Myxococcales bacterium]MCB9580991.1 helix-turn-helix domain-containing protein [Polyangiaceae bacterium]
MTGRLAVIPEGELRELVSSAVAEAMAEVPGAAPEVLDRARAAELLGVSLATLRRLVTAGEVREHRLGDSPRYLRSELLEDVRRRDP